MAQMCLVCLDRLKNREFEISKTENKCCLRITVINARANN